MPSRVCPYALLASLLSIFHFHEQQPVPRRLEIFPFTTYYNEFIQQENRQFRFMARRPYHYVKSFVYSNDHRITKVLFTISILLITSD